MVDVDNGSLATDSRPKSVGLVWEVAATWHPSLHSPDELGELSQCDNSTTNIILVINYYYYYYYFRPRYFIPRVWDIKQSVWCLERLQCGLGNCESVRQADCIEMLDCRGDPLVQECRFMRVGGADYDWVINVAEAETFIPAHLLLSLNLVRSAHQLHSPRLLLVQLTTPEIISTPKVQVGHSQWNLPSHTAFSFQLQLHLAVIDNVDHLHIH